MNEFVEKRYALALYEIAEPKGKVDEYIRDLKTIVDLMKNDKGFLQIIKHPQISTSRKKEAFEELFKNRIDSQLLSFLFLLIDKNRIDTLDEKLKEMEKIKLERNNQVIAKVKTVVPLDEEDRKNLIEGLNKKYNKKIILDEEIDKSIIGGVFVMVGDEVIDGTIKQKLEKMRKIMLNRE
jgi:F-type H+-transporting ATPase subunit delta